MDINNMSDEELKLTMALSKASTIIDKYMALLFIMYGLILSKKDLSVVLKKSEQTIDRRIKEGTNIPQYLKSSEGKKSSYMFPTYEVAKYLSMTIKVA